MVRLVMAPLLLATSPCVQGDAPAKLREPSRRCPSQTSGWPLDKRPQLLRLTRVFMDNASTPNPPRSGFHYPRYDGRLHDGDEVQLQSRRGSWLFITTNPFFTLRGKSFALQRGGNGGFCTTVEDDPTRKVVCGQQSPGRSSWFVLGDAGQRVSLKLQHRFCTDRPDGIHCNAERVGSLELFDVVEVNAGRIALRGSRQDRYCADIALGIVCNEDSMDATVDSPTTFSVVSDAELEPIAVQTEHKNKAATFVVHRDDIDSPRVALQCKDDGRYLRADEGRSVSCSSRLPTPFLAARRKFRTTHKKGVAKWDRASVIFQSEESKMYLDSGEDEAGSLAKFSSADAVLWRIHLSGACETVRPLIRGVNLGNWFVLEKWMAGYLFYNESGRPWEDACHAQDEYSLMSLLGPSVARRRLEEHWASWISEADIRWMSEHGINAVRVPFGYWMVFPMTPFVPGQLKYLERLFDWCEKYFVTVLLDFHGLKGSQTGSPTSGNCGGCGNNSCGKTWLKFLEEQKINLEVIRRLTVRFSMSPAYLGFAVANEVSGDVDKEDLMQFYQQAYDLIRSQNKDALVVLYETHAPSLFPWDNFQGTLMDIHIYFGWSISKPTLDQQENLRRARHRIAHVHWPVVVGEWSLAANGHPTLTWEPHRRDAFFDKFARMQLQAWETHSIGWFYWNYKTRFINSTWNYRDMCAVGWLPGCGNKLHFGPAEWWRASDMCVYAYMDGVCKSNMPEMAQNSYQGGSSGTALWWLVPVAALLMVGLTTFAVTGNLAPGWKKLLWDNTDDDFRREHSPCREEARAPEVGWQWVTPNAVVRGGRGARGQTTPEELYGAGRGQRLLMW